MMMQISPFATQSKKVSKFISLMSIISLFLLFGLGNFVCPAPSEVNQVASWSLLQAKVEPNQRIVGVSLVQVAMKKNKGGKGGLPQPTGTFNASNAQQQQQMGGFGGGQQQQQQQPQNAMARASQRQASRGQMNRQFQQFGHQIVQPNQHQQERNMIARQQDQIAWQSVINNDFLLQDKIKRETMSKYQTAAKEHSTMVNTKNYKQHEQHVRKVAEKVKNYLQPKKLAQYEVELHADLKKQQQNDYLQMMQMQHQERLKQQEQSMRHRMQQAWKQEGEKTNKELTEMTAKGMQRRR